MKFYIYTFGCKTNTYESEAVSDLLEDTGRYERTDSYLDANAVIVNSCMVTEESEKKAKKLIRRIKRENPDCCVVLSGCMPQVLKEKTNVPGADIICGNSRRNDIVRLLDGFFAGKRDIVDVPSHEEGEKFELLYPRRYRDLTRANLKIEDGCDCFCSYCVIPFARGRVRSMSLADISRIAGEFVREGHREVVLTGINIGKYGSDTGAGLFDAVKAVADAGAERIRLGSLEIDLLSDDELRRLAAVPQLCPHFHTSLQSGSDKVLKKMNRHYSAAEYCRKTELLRELFPDCSVTTDVIVGFPGETEEDFLETVAFVEKTGFFRVHVFPYSRRPGTVADRLPGQVSVEEKKRRVSVLEKKAAELKKQFLDSQVGKIAEVLFERSSGGIARGHSANYIEVRVKGGNELKNVIEKVRITGVDGSGEWVFGEIL